MKKRVLFIIGTLQSGGVSKSMVSLLNAWDCNKYETDLLLCSQAGNIYKEQIPKQVNVIYDPRIENAMGGLKSYVWFLRHGHILLALGVLIRLVLSRFSKAKAGVLISRMMPVVTPIEYDLIVDYGGQQLLYYMIDKLKGKKKISFFHSDYRQWPYYYAADKKYYRYVDVIFSISDACVKSLREVFPEYADKVALMENISSPKLLHQLAEEYIDFPLGNVFVTVGHINEQKGTDFAIEAAKILKSRGVQFQWLFVGKIIRQDWIEKVHVLGLDDAIKFVGIKTNPYPYMKRATLIVHPARFEGKSIALDEAKILCKPIVVTNFSTVHDQFEDGVNASICEMNGKSLAEAIVHLAENGDLQHRYITYLTEHIVDNSTEVEKLYQLVDE